MLTLLQVYSQDEYFKGTIYSFVPQYLINRGIRVDIEKQIKSRHFIQLCPQFYLSEKEDDSFEIKKNSFTYLIGGGLNLYHKIFTAEQFKDYGLYLAYGLSYNYFHIEYLDDSSTPEVSAKGSINKIGGDLVLGYQLFYRNLLSIDVFTGLGTRVSFMDADGADTDRFNTGYYGYNYTGNIMLLGFRIGVIL